METAIADLERTQAAREIKMRHPCRGEPWQSTREKPARPPDTPRNRAERRAAAAMRHAEGMPFTGAEVESSQRRLEHLFGFKDDE